ncbi:phage head-tail connector protein [Bacillus sp. YC2]|uniref:phage head-tail connector protein n=1 Tax=Bacillus sp. YC2 TaxID=2861287 RepID=UPI00223A7C01|nr:phage head-tail connector protein [Bacillus sp. YC2]
MMELSELKTRLGIPVDDETQDACLQIELDDAIEHAVDYCNNPFTNKEGELFLPSPIKKGIALMIKIDRTGQPGVTAHSIGGMSKSFASEDEKYQAVYRLWRPYKKLKVLELKKRRRC